MKFDRITENQAYEYIVEATKQLHDKGIVCKEISMHPDVKALGLDLSRCTTSGYGLLPGSEKSTFRNLPKNGSAPHTSGHLPTSFCAHTRPESPIVFCSDQMPAQIE